MGKKQLIRRLIEYYKNAPVPLKATVWFTVGNVLLRGISFFASPICAHFLSTDEYGKYSIFSMYQSIILIIATWELSQGAYQRGLLKFKEDRVLLKSSVIVLSTIITCAVFLVCLPFSDTICGWIGVESQTYWVLFLYCLFYPAYMGWMTQKRLFYDYKKATIATFLFTLIPTVVSLCFTAQFRTAQARVFSMLIVYIACYIGFYVRSIRPKLMVQNMPQVKKQWAYVTKFALPLVPHSLSYLILGQADRVMIGSMISTSEAGIYSVGNSISMAVNIFQTSIQQALSPWIYNRLDKKNYEGIGRVLTLAFAIINALILLCVIVAPELIHVLYSEEYYSSVWVVPPIMLSITFMFFYSTSTTFIKYCEKTRYIMYVTLVCATLNIVLNYIGLQYFSYVVCGYTTLICYVLMGFGSYIFCRQLCKEHQIPLSVFNIKQMVLISLVFAALTAIVAVFYPRPLIRYCIFAVLIGILIWRRKDIINLFKQVRRERR